jgi:hypothetical protein
VPSFAASSAQNFIDVSRWGRFILLLMMIGASGLVPAETYRATRLQNNGVIPIGQIIQAKAKGSARRKRHVRTKVERSLMIVPANRPLPIWI